MDLNSITFLLFAIGVIVLSNCFPSASGRSTVLAFASAVFIGSYASSPSQLMPLVAYVILCFAVVRAVQWRPSRTVLWMGVIAVCLCFVYLKKFSFIDTLAPLPFTYVMVGFSYILFRVIHLAIDISQGMLQDKVEPIAFFNYTCNFLSFVSGPIQRYQDFVKSGNTRLQLDDEKVFAAFSRIVGGFVKVAVISGVADQIFNMLATPLLEHSGGIPISALAIRFAAASLVYVIYLYYNFSGYMDIVIGIGWLIGLDLPENFNKPFSSRNFLEFWSRWHMTLSGWFKTYVFNPLMKCMINRVQAVSMQPAVGVIAFFLTFMLMGMWHGTTGMFLIYGLMMGAGASANKLWQIAMPFFIGKQQYKSLSRGVVYSYLCTGLTCAWFAFGLTCFWLDLPQFTSLSRSLGTLGILFAFCALTAASGTVLFMTHCLGERLLPATSRLVTLARGLIARNLILGSRVMLLAVVVSFFHKASEFVYRAF